MMNGNFTLPGEAGHEALTLEYARRWGADAIRDSDGTALSDEILNSGYEIYSTVCPVREHNGWIRDNGFARQQTFLCSRPATATGGAVSIRLLDGFFSGQFEINDSPGAMKYWQVYDRTSSREVERDRWSYDAAAGEVKIEASPWRQYTVSFLAWRVWEEISMYNHVTNGWDAERLMQLNPYRPEAMDYLKKWMARWCAEHPRTDVVRFTSLFYNFAWIWGSDKNNRSVFADWASYDFTVCPEALDDFAARYDYALCAEDFVNNGKYNATHRVPKQTKRDWMEFVGEFVRRFGRELVEIVHAAGKRAFVFFDDNWIGLEPYSGRFDEFGFDGLIKCVFSGYEARMCAGVAVKERELRFHPYLFPVGLNGAPTFSPGGDPGGDALGYWTGVRRALLRASVERCGLGGYLHLIKEYPGFASAMDKILKEFRLINELHAGGAPVTLRPRVAVLHAWGGLRTWTLSGHFHETEQHALVHVLESLSGLPFDVEFISFDDIINGAPRNTDVIICAGAAGDAWSGGENWGDERIVTNLTEWVHGGGVFIGIGEPSALPGGFRFLRMAHILGVDVDNGEYACHGRPAFIAEVQPGLIPDGFDIEGRGDCVLVSPSARVLAGRHGRLSIVMNAFGGGAGVYCASFTHAPCSARFLQNLILFATNNDMTPDGATDDPHVECAYYPASGRLVMINNSTCTRDAACVINNKTYAATLSPRELKIFNV